MQWSVLPHIACRAALSFQWVALTYTWKTFKRHLCPFCKIAQHPTTWLQRHHVLWHAWKYADVWGVTLRINGTSMCLLMRGTFLCMSRKHTHTICVNAPSESKRILSFYCRLCPHCGDFLHFLSRWHQGKGLSVGVTKIVLSLVHY